MNPRRHPRRRDHKHYRKAMFGALMIPLTCVALLVAKCLGIL